MHVNARDIFQQQYQESINHTHSGRFRRRFCCSCGWDSFHTGYLVIIGQVLSPYVHKAVDLDRRCEYSVS